MTSTTGNFCMFSFQWEIGAIVIESFREPAFGHMAPGTVCYPLNCECVPMDILMATGTFGIQISKFLFDLR